MYNRWAPIVYLIIISIILSNFENKFFGLTELIRSGNAIKGQNI